MIIPVKTLMILIMIIPAQELMTIPADVLMMMIIPAHVLMTTMPATELKNIPANVLMTMMIYYKLKSVTCNYLQSERNTMLNMTIIHYVKWFTDQRMCLTMKTARKFCCRKQQICHEKTI